MLLLVTIGLVLVGAISLVIGFVSSSLAPIYLSIVCSIVAGGVLVVFSRMSRKQGAAATAGGPSAAGEPGGDTATLEVVGAATQTSAPVVPDVDFPIESYDSLKVGEIIPLLAELDLDELDVVREHEEKGKNRATVIKRIDEMIDQREAEDEAATAVPAVAAAEEPDIPEVVDVPDVPAPVAPGGGTSGLAIENYDSLTIAQILPLLPELDDDELEDVAQYEEAHKNRSAIIARIDEIFETGETGAPAPAKKATGKKATAKKATAKKTPAKKAAAPAKKSPAKKAAAPAKKAATKKAAAPAKKAATKKAAAPAKKAAPAQKTAKKAAKATKKR